VNAFLEERRSREISSVERASILDRYRDEADRRWPPSTNGLAGA
jgi:hypothetical protein